MNNISHSYEKDFVAKFSCVLFQMYEVAFVFVFLWIFIHPRSPCRVGLVVSVSASHTVGHEFASRLGHTKDHHINSTNCLPA